MIKLSYLLSELKDLYEHYGDIDVDCDDFFEVKVIQQEDKDETYFVSFDRPDVFTLLAACREANKWSLPNEVHAQLTAAINGASAVSQPESEGGAG